MKHIRSELGKHFGSVGIAQMQKAVESLFNACSDGDAAKRAASATIAATKHDALDRAGWRRSRNAHKILPRVKGEYRSREPIPGEDHLQGWHNAQTGESVVVIEPYDLSQEGADRLTAWCHEHGLQWFVGRSFGVHFPGETVPIVIQVKGERVNGPSTNILKRAGALEAGRRQVAPTVAKQDVRAKGATR